VWERPAVHGNWRVVGGRACAWFAAASHGDGAALAGAVVDAGLPLPDLDVRRGGVRVRLAATDLAAAGPAADLAGADLAGADLAGAVSEAASRLGLTPHPGMLQEVRLRFESPDPARAEPFWRAALGHGPDGTDRWRRGPGAAFAPAVDPRPLRTRPHVDVGLPGPVGDAVVALRAAGGQVTRTAPWFTTLTDTDGNEVDVVPGGDLPGAPGWRAMFGGMAAYPSADPRVSADLAAAAARLADAAGIALLIDVRPEGVVLDSGKDEWERVPGFADLAAAVQAAAGAAGLAADPGALRFVQVGIDALDVAAVSRFWRAALGYVPSSDPRLSDLHDPRELGPVVFLQPMDAPGDDERRRQRNRIQLELLLPADRVAARTAAALAAGGRTSPRAASPTRRATSSSSPPDRPHRRTAAQGPGRSSGADRCSGA
jgi:hypothetical protein